MQQDPESVCLDMQNKERINGRKTGAAQLLAGLIGVARQITPTPAVQIYKCH